MTGLAAVFLVVMSAGALTRSASEERPIQTQSNSTASGALPDLMGENLTVAPQEPLAELGVAPSPEPSLNDTGGNAAR